jgi:hypothetical protein
MKRRAFLNMLLAAPLAAAVSAGKRLPAWVQAKLRRGHYPGPIKPLDGREIRRPGPWAG